MGLLRMTGLAHLMLEKRVKEGDTVIDATAGNGHDTVFLAQKVGDAGKVHAFDIQEQAIMSTRKRLENEKLLHRVILHHASHTEIAHVGERIEAAVFNLGYLPGSDKAIITQPESTCAALAASLSLLRPGGIVVIVAYEGHEGGKREAAAVKQFAQKLPVDTYVVGQFEQINAQNNPPFLLVIEKRAPSAG